MLRVISSLLLLHILLSGSAQLVINEIQVSNTTTIPDEDGAYKDWFEIYNPTNASVSLAGWSVSDDEQAPGKWPLPPVNLSAGEYRIIWASGKNRGNNPIRYETAVFPQDNWKYLLPSEEPDGSWRTTGFDESLWPSGPGGFGYADDDDGTVISPAISVYLRRTFHLQYAENVAEVFLHMDYDDAFVAYLNGVEIARAGIGSPGTPPAFSDPATTDHEALGYQGQPIDGFIIDPAIWLGALEPGENVLAIQVHNTNLQSSDLSSNAWLTFGMLLSPPQFPDAPAWMGFTQSSELHTNFSLSTGETLLLTGPQGTTGDLVLITPTGLDHSYARSSDGGPLWCYSIPATPGNTNTGTNCASGYEAIPVFNITSGVFNDTVSLVVTCPAPEATAYYTLDGSIPTEFSPVFPDTLEVSQTRIVSARCISNPGMLPSPVTKNTYLINELYSGVPVISISTNPENLWDETIGIYVPGPPDYSTSPPYFGANFWEDWERQAYIEYFDTTGSCKFEGPIGLKIHGGWSRAEAQKSFRIMCRDDYGMKHIVYPLIPDKPFIETFESFNLRNGGNDYGGPRYHDALMQRAMNPTHADYMAYTPVITFLNGEYWGMYELRENLNEDYCENNHGVPASEATVISYNYMGFNVINGSPDSFADLYAYTVQHDPQSPEFLAGLREHLDIENYVDYIIAETYYGNGDWSNGWINNTKFWHDDRPGGKWRFMLMDLDFGAYADPCTDFITTAGDESYYTDQIFARVIQNPGFRAYFITRYLDLVNSVFKTENLRRIRDEMRNELQDAMPRHCERWSTNYDWWYYGYDWRLDWNDLRQNCVPEILRSLFSLDEQLDFTVNVLPHGAGRVHISTIEPGDDQYPWTGVYFKGMPVRVTAIPNPGFTFRYWVPTEEFPFEDTEMTRDIILQESIGFTAFFEGDTAESPLMVSEFMYHADENNDCGDWIELHNTLEVPLDISGWKIRDSNYFNCHEFPLQTIIPADSYVVVVSDTSLFTTVYPDVANFTGQLGFNLNNSADEIRVYDHKGIQLRHLSYSDSSPWPDDTDGTGRSVEFDILYTDESDPANWLAGCYGGSPGEAYDPTCGIISFVAEESPTSGTIHLFPNPAEHGTTITIAMDGTHDVLSIYSSTGQLIARHAVKGKTRYELPTAQLASGLYVLQLSGDIGTQSGKFVLR